MDKREKKLNRVPEDIEDALRVVEKCYDITFEGDELGYIRTFGQLTDHIISKIKLLDKEDCTDQQAFYKLRSAIEKVKPLDKLTVSPKTQLTDIFPRETRRKEIKRIENDLGFQLQALRPSLFVTNLLLLILLVSIIGLFIQWRFGLLGITLSIIGFRISLKTGKEFKDVTLGQLTDRATQYNCLKSRRQSGTMNRNEIQDKIRKLFIDHLGLEDKDIDKDTVLV